MRIVRLQGLPVVQQLRIEEALLRADSGNWCLIHTGAPPAIVMGISGKVEELVYLPTTLPLIKRFSGGGTVYIDPQTVLVTFICNGVDSGVEVVPEAVLHWSYEVYCPIVPGLTVRENDYVLGDKKCGGNAQYLTKGRWLHHTAFLWDYDSQAMEKALRLPHKAPRYRENRSHRDFLCTLRPYFPDKEAFIQTIIDQVSARFSATVTDVAVAQEICERPHRRTCQEVVAMGILRQDEGSC